MHAWSELRNNTEIDQCKYRLMDSAHVSKKIDLLAEFKLKQNPTMTYFTSKTSDTLYM